MSQEFRMSYPVPALAFDQRFIAKGFHISYGDRSKDGRYGTLFFSEKSAILYPDAYGTISYLDARHDIDARPFLEAIDALLQVIVYSEDDPEFFGFSSEAEMQASFGQSDKCAICRLL